MRSRLLFLGLVVVLSLSGCKALLKAGLEGGQAAAKTTTKVAAKGGDNAAKLGEAGTDVATKAGKNASEAEKIADAAKHSDEMGGEVAERVADATEALLEAQELFESETEQEWNQENLGSFRSKSAQVRNSLNQEFQTLKPTLGPATAKSLELELEKLDKGLAALSEPGADAKSVAKVKASGLELTKQLGQLRKKG